MPGGGRAETDRSLVLDEENACLWRGDERIQLPPKAFALLAHLAAHPERLVTKHELLDAVWPDVAVGDSVLKVNVRLIREALGDDAQHPWLIETVHRRGYRIIGKLFRKERTPVSYDLASGSPTASRLVGREASMRRLFDAWIDAQAGRRRLVFVTGEPGIGKSALVGTFSEVCLASDEPPRIARGQCLEGFGANEAYLPVLDAVEDLLRSADGDTASQLLHTYAPTWVARLPRLARQQPGDEARTPAGASRERMLREFATFLEAHAAERPLLLVFEDLHWGDPSTVALIAYLGQRHAPARILIVGTYRPVELIVATHPLREIAQTLTTRGQAEEIPLWYLQEEDIADYMERTLAGPCDAAAAAELMDQTSGNPLFLVNLVQHHVAQGFLVQVDGRWRFREADMACGGEVPQELRGAIQRRLDSFDDDDRTLLQAASVAGPTFTTAAVAAAIAAPVEAVEEACERLQRRGDIVVAREVAHFADGSACGRYAFLHVLFRNVLYEEIPPLRRAETHRLIGDWGERHHLGPAELAFHFERAGGPAHARKAIDHAIAAAAQATVVFAYDEAIRHVEQAIELGRSLPVRDPRCEAEIYILLGEARQRAGHVATADSAFHAGAAAASEAGSAILLARAAAGLGHSYQRIGSPDEGLIALLESAVAALPPGDHPAKALALAHLDYALCSRPGSLAYRAGMGQEALAMAKRVGDVDTQIRVLQYTQWAFRGPRSEETWCEILADVEALLPQAVDAERDLMLRIIRSTGLLEAGRLDQAIASIDDLTERAEEARILWCMWLAARLRAALALLQGRFTEAEQHITESLELGRRTDHPNVVQLYGSQMALLAIERGDFAAAWDLVRAAIDEYPEVRTWRAAAAFLLAERGAASEARPLLAQVGADDFEGIAQDTTWLIAMGLAAAASERLGEGAHGRTIYRLLLPFRDCRTGLGSSIYSLGHMERYLGLAAAAAGMEEAESHLRSALAGNESTGARPWAVLTRADLARVLRRRRGGAREAQRLLREARAEATALGMDGWLGRLT